jgi:hypothetical protein
MKILRGYISICSYLISQFKLNCKTAKMKICAFYITFFCLDISKKQIASPDKP